jgi:hypothetical protein
VLTLALRPGGTAASPEMEEPPQHETLPAGESAQAWYQPATTDVQPLPEGTLRMGGESYAPPKHEMAPLASVVQAQGSCPCAMAVAEPAPAGHENGKWPVLTHWQPEGRVVKQMP